MSATTMTPETLSLFVALWTDAPNWSGEPMLDITKEQRGNLTDLKKRGLVTTFKSEGCEWVKFTETGREFAALTLATETR
jgi:hypothetical protein